MFKCEKKVNFVDKNLGVTKDGEQYISINCMPVGSSSKFSFMSKVPDVIDNLKNLNIARFQEVTVVLDFSREFNNEKRTSYWSCELLGIK